MQTHLAQDNRQVLVLNADYRPLSLHPLSTCSWQDAIKAWCQDKVDILESYEDEVHSPSLTISIPCVIVLKQFIPQKHTPPFTRRNLLIRDMYSCQYCGKEIPLKPQRREDIGTMDHVYPKSKGGPRTWENIVLSCASCNIKKRDRTPEEAGMPLRHKPKAPTMRQLWQNSLKLLVVRSIPSQWYTYLLPDEVEAIENSHNKKNIS